MNFQDMLKETSQSLSQFWAVRNFRERIILKLATLIVLTGIVYALLIAPAIIGRDQLNRNLPGLRLQVSQMQALSKEAMQISSNPAKAMILPTKQNLEASLGGNGLKPFDLTLTGDYVKIELPSVSFSGTMAWIDETQKSMLLSVVNAHIVALNQPDMVNAILTLKPIHNE